LTSSHFFWVILLGSIAPAQIFPRHPFHFSMALPGQFSSLPLSHCSQAPAGPFFLAAGPGAVETVRAFFLPIGSLAESSLGVLSMIGVRVYLKPSFNVRVPFCPGTPLPRFLREQVAGVLFYEGYCYFSVPGSEGEVVLVAVVLSAYCRFCGQLVFAFAFLFW